MPMPHPKSKLFPPNDHYRGLMAENAVGGVLNLITLERDHVYVFHSVEEENEGSGETDHLLLHNRLLLLIETKNRGNVQQIKINKNGEAYAKRNNGQSVSYSNNSLAKKVAFYQEQYPFLTVQGILVVHHDLQNWNSEVPELLITTVPQLLSLILEKIDAETSKPADTAAIVKDIASRCIRNEQIN